MLLLFIHSHVLLFVTPWTAAHQAFLSLTISQSFPKFMSIASMMSSSHLFLWCPLFLLPLIFPSIRDFSNELALHINWPKYWSFSFSISLSNEYSGLIFFKIDWFELLAARGIQESSLELQFKGINSLALYFPYGPALTTVHDHEEAQSLDYNLLADCCLCFSTLSRFVIVFQPRSKHPLISWL